MKIALRATLLAFVVGASFAGSCDKHDDDVIAPSAFPIRYVATTGSDSGACDVQTRPCQTIAYAIGRASDDDEVHVAAGSYTGNLDVTKRVTIRGAGATTTTVVGTITITASRGNIYALTVLANSTQANGITVPNNRTADIADIVVRGFNNGILATAPTRLDVRNSQILQSGGDGFRVTVDSGSFVNISGTLVSGSGDDGLQVNYGLTGGSAGRSVTIENSKFDNNASAGIQFEDWVDSSNITITGNCVRMSRTEAGIYFTRSSPAGLRTSNNNIVSNACAALIEPAGSTRFNMTGNWWGAASGPTVTQTCSGTNTIVGPIDVSPVLSAPATSSLSCP